ncbi:MAG: GrlR family regulatory protein [Rickettsiales bacterium]
MALETIKESIEYNSQGVEALYLVEFGDIASSEYRNGGVVVFETNKVFGGDSGYYYVGSFEVKNGELLGQARITKHNPHWDNVFGDSVDSFEVDIIAKIDGVNIVGSMKRLDMPSFLLPIRFSRLEDLP